MQTLFLAYLAGALTTLNPCVLPMVPFVLATALREGRFGPVALIAGMSLTFTVLGTLVASIGPAIGLSTELIRVAGASIMIALGAAMLLPATQRVFATGFAPVADQASGFLDRLAFGGLTGQFITGMLLGLVWSPCAGPSLFAAIGLASQTGTVAQAATAMFAFSLGAGTILLALAYGAREVIARRKAALMDLANSGRAKILFASLFVGMGAMILFGIDKRIEAALLTIMPEWLMNLTTRF